RGPIGRDYRQPRGHRLQQSEALALVGTGREDQGPRFGQQRCHLLGPTPSEPFDLRMEALQARTQVPIAHDGEPEAGRSGNLPGPEEVVDPFLMRYPAHEEDPVTSGGRLGPGARVVYEIGLDQDAVRFESGPEVDVPSEVRQRAIEGDGAPDPGRDAGGHGGGYTWRAPVAVPPTPIPLPTRAHHPDRPRSPAAQKARLDACGPTVAERHDNGAARPCGGPHHGREQREPGVVDVDQ